MIEEDRRIEIYNTVFGFFINNDISTIPIQEENICQLLNIELVKLSDIIAHTGLTQEEIFLIWGNEDGVLQSHDKVYKIAYNDYKPICRQRFTIMEEISHMMLNHISDPNFNIFNQEYDEATYLRYDEEARMCAGLLLCPPQFFYDYEDAMSTGLFQDIYNVSKLCAKTRISILSKYETEIKSSPLYSFLPTIDLDRGLYFANKSSLCAADN